MTSDRLWVNSLKSTKPADNSISRWSVKTGLMWETLDWIQQGGGVSPDMCIGTGKCWKVMAAALIWDSGISGMLAYMPGCVLVVAQIPAVEGCSPWVVDATALSSLTGFLVSSAHSHNWKIDIGGAKPSWFKKAKCFKIAFLFLLQNASGSETFSCFTPSLWPQLSLQGGSKAVISWQRWSQRVTPALLWGLQGLECPAVPQEGADWLLSPLQTHTDGATSVTCCWRLNVWLPVCVRGCSLLLARAWQQPCFTQCISRSGMLRGCSSQNQLPW